MSKIGRINSITDFEGFNNIIYSPNEMYAIIHYNENKIYMINLKTGDILKNIFNNITYITSRDDMIILLNNEEIIKTSFSRIFNNNKLFIVWVIIKMFNGYFKYINNIKMNISSYVNNISKFDTFSYVKNYIGEFMYISPDKKYMIDESFNKYSTKDGTVIAVNKIGYDENMPIITEDNKYYIQNEITGCTCIGIYDIKRIPNIKSTNWADSSNSLYLADDISTFSPDDKLYGKIINIHCISNSSKIIITSQYLVRLVDIENRKIISIIKNNKIKEQIGFTIFYLGDEITSSIMSPDEKYIFIVYENNIIEGFNIYTSEKIYEINFSKYFTSPDEAWRWTENTKICSIKITKNCFHVIFILNNGTIWKQPILPYLRI